LTHPGEDNDGRDDDLEPKVEEEDEDRDEEQEGRYEAADDRFHEKYEEGEI
jgi:hypothetical protein